MEANYAYTSEVLCIVRVIPAECSLVACSLACKGRFFGLPYKSEASFTASSKNKSTEMVTYKVGQAPAL